MARRDHNGPKTDQPLQDGSSSKKHSPRPRGQGYPGIRAAARPFLMAGLSAILLTAAFPPLEISWMAYVALVPLLIMAVRTPTPRRVLLAGWFGGMVFFAINMWWFWPVTQAGAIAIVPYLGLYWAVFAWAVRRINQTLRLPLTILAPVVWVPLEFIRAWMLTGLPWVFVGHTQYENLALIQTADLMGAYAQSFLVLMTAGLVTDFLTRPLFVARSEATPADAPATLATPGGQTSLAGPLPRRSHFSGVLATMLILVLAAWVGTVWYGLWRLDQSATRPGPVVTSVQTCVPQELKQAVRLQRLSDLEKSEEEMVGTQCNLSKQGLAWGASRGLKPDLVVWPETMVPGIQNEDFLTGNLSEHIKDPDILGVFSYLQRRSQVYWKNIRETAREINAPILYGAHGVFLEGAYRLPGGGFMTIGPRFNTAYLVGPESKNFVADQTYAKSHLVPFGEYLPFKESFPWLHNFLRSFTPYAYDYSLTPGSHDQPPFVLKYAGGEARFQVPICYEDAMPYRVREMVRPAEAGGRKAVDFLVNISNDGWFDGSIELDQHLNLCVFRAVENRVPIVRSVNTGISAIISPVGRIESFVADDHGERHKVTGQITGRLTLDNRLAPYTCLGDVMPFWCMVAAGVLLAAALIQDRRHRRAA
jgi:apolipoprotein N-acyltransferase